MPNAGRPLFIPCSLSVAWCWINWLLNKLILEEKQWEVSAGQNLKPGPLCHEPTELTTWPLPQSVMSFTKWRVHNRFSYFFSSLGTNWENSSTTNSTLSSSFNDAAPFLKTFFSWNVECRRRRYMTLGTGDFTSTDDITKNVSTPHFVRLFFFVERN